MCSCPPPWSPANSSTTSGSSSNSSSSSRSSRSSDDSDSFSDDYDMDSDDSMFGPLAAGNLDERHLEMLCEEKGPEA